VSRARTNRGHANGLDLRLDLFHELLHEHGATGLYVTHNPPEAQALGDLAAVLEEGRIA
jgi:ABC-type thiamine transport system ATPase subunit